MIDPPEDRRPPLTPQLALRVAIVGSVTLALFAIIFFRLWFLQVLSGDQYLAKATTNRVRKIAVAAPRGEILDRSGTVLVDNIKALAVRLSPPDLPPAAGSRDELYRRLAFVLGISTRREKCVVPGAGPERLRTRRLAPIPCDVATQIALLPYGDVTIKTNVSRYDQYYLAEHQSEFPGVGVQRVYVSHYPHGSLAAQVLGTVGPLNQIEIAERAYRRIPPNSIIGQSGLEASYNHYLLGTAGLEKVQVDSLGQPTGDLKGRAPVAGHNLALSLDAGLQRVGEQSLAQSIASNPPASGGSFVALNPENGEVYAMGSLPSFDPSIFTRTLSQAAFARVTNTSSNFPLENRVLQGAGPTGSTFKPITATAALQSHAWSTTAIYDDTGKFCLGSGASIQCRRNAGGAVNGPVNLVDAIKVSSDTFFYKMGALTNTATPVLHPNGGPLQSWAHQFGIGRPTGIDVPGELLGTLPSPAWRLRRDKLELQCEQATGPYSYTNGHSTGPHKLKGWHRSPTHATCGIADGRPWSIGDNVSLAVGQGDVQVTPLQLAVAYAALANGGTIIRPHLGLNVEDSVGTVLQKIDPLPSRRIPINPFYLETIRQGLRAAASQPGGTSADVFANFPEQVYGKTGTAQYNGQSDYSWYACFVPRSATTKPIVVVVRVEQGGFGAVAAAPVARQILSQWFFGKPGAYKAGSSATL